jgi:hypothetical protein
MDQHAGRLVDDNQMLVFINDIERNVFGTHRVLARDVEISLDIVSAAHTESYVLQASVYLALAVSDNPTEVHPAQSREVTEQVIF